MQALLDDLRALEQLIEEGRIETGVRRIGAEQEMFLVDDSWRPCPRSAEVLSKLEGQSCFTPELALFNLEANLDPRVLTGTCLSDMEGELERAVAAVRGAAADLDTKVLLCGILPTLRRADLSLENMVPSPRYHALNAVMTEMRGGEFRTLIKGLDELQVRHENVMLESATTSFQLHFQVGAEEFASLYNLAQAVAAPVLAAAVNSPLFLKHRLWHETRVALFQQSLDARNEAQTERGVQQRVTFGERWVERSVLEIFREDVARFRVLLASDLGESSSDLMARGEVPPLQALCLHNGTVYRWNRPCYGVKDGIPHLRIENRALPAGPTVRDEIANSALYFGLMVGLGEEVGDITRVMQFDDAKQNFMAAARYGLNAQFQWIDGRRSTAQELILSHLLPLARAGLEEKQVPAVDVDTYLGVIEERVTSGRTGAQWALDSLAAMGRGSADHTSRAITAASHEHQLEGRPVHTWPLAELRDAEGWQDHFFRTVGQVMSRDLFTVHPEDVVDLAGNLMDWEHLRRVPVEDDDGRVVGIMTQRGLLRVLLRATGRKNKTPVAVREVMVPDPITISPEQSTLDAIDLMRRHRVGCLPVVKDGKLVGIVTEHDFIDAATSLLEDKLKRPIPGPDSGPGPDSSSDPDRG